MEGASFSHTVIIITTPSSVAHIPNTSKGSVSVTRTPWRLIENSSLGSFDIEKSCIGIITHSIMFVIYGIL